MMQERDDDLAIRAQQELSELEFHGIAAGLNTACCSTRSQYLKELLVEPFDKITLSSRTIPTTPESGGIHRALHLVHYSPEEHIRSTTAVEVKDIGGGRLQLTFKDRTGSKLVAYLGDNGELESLTQEGRRSIYHHRLPQCNSPEEKEHAEAVLQQGLRFLYYTPKILPLSRQENQEYAQLALATVAHEDTFNFSQPHDRARFVQKLAETHYHSSGRIVIDFAREPGRVKGNPIDRQGDFILAADHAEIQSRREGGVVISFLQRSDSLIFYLDKSFELTTVAVTYNGISSNFFSRRGSHHDASVKRETEAERILEVALNQLKDTPPVEKTDPILQESFAQVRLPGVRNLGFLEDRAMVLGMLLTSSRASFTLTPERRGLQRLFNTVNEYNPYDILKNAVSLEVIKAQGRVSLYFTARDGKRLEVYLNEKHELSSIQYSCRGYAGGTLYNREHDVFSGRERQKKAERVFEEVWKKILQHYKKTQL